jgi:transposase
VILDPELEAKIPSRKLDYPGQLQRVTRRLRSMPQTARVRIAREQTLRIGALTREAETLKRELRDLIRAQHPELLQETGCGPLTAAILIGQTAGAERFKSDAHFARFAGVAPIPSPLADTTAIAWTVMATARSIGLCTPSRSPGDAWTRRPAPTYSARKAEGKTRMESMRCLKRHLARHYHRLLSARGERRCGTAADAHPIRVIASQPGESPASGPRRQDEPEPLPTRLSILERNR